MQRSLLALVAFLFLACPTLVEAKIYNHHVDICQDAWIDVGKKENPNFNPQALNAGWHNIVSDWRGIWGGCRQKLEALEARGVSPEAALAQVLPPKEAAHAADRNGTPAVVSASADRSEPATHARGSAVLISTPVRKDLPRLPAAQPAASPPVKHDVPARPAAKPPHQPAPILVEPTLRSSTAPAAAPEDTLGRSNGITNSQSDVRVDPRFSFDMLGIIVWFLGGVATTVLTEYCLPFLTHYYLPYLGVIGFALAVVYMIVDMMVIPRAKMIVEPEPANDSVEEEPPVQPTIHDDGHSTLVIPEWSAEQAAAHEQKRLRRILAENRERHAAEAEHAVAVAQTVPVYVAPAYAAPRQAIWGGARGHGKT